MSQRNRIDRQLLSRNRSARRSLFLAVGVGIALSVIVVAQAWLLATILGGFVESRRLNQVSLIGFVLLISLRFIVGALGEHLAQTSAATTVAGLRHELLIALESQGSRELSLRQRGRMVLEATRGLRKLESFYARYVPAAVVAALAPLVALVFLAVTDWPSLLITLGLMAILPFVMIHFGRKANVISAVKWSRLGSLASRMLSIIRATPSLKALGELDVARDELSSITNATASSIIATLRVAFLSSAGLEFLSGVGVGLVAMLAGFRLVHGSLSISSAFAVVLVTPEVFLPLRRAGAAFHEASEGREAGRGVLEVLDTPRSPTIGTLRPATASLHLDECWVSGMNQAVSVDIEPQTHLIIRGPSGAGKSTLLHLVAGLIAPESGTLSVGDTPMVEVDQPWWRSKLGFVPQRPHLFSGSVRDNVLLGSSATDAELYELLEALGLARLVARGLDSHLGEGTIGVSGGELQRLALARVLLAPREWLLLDEPIAHLDASHSAQVRAAIGHYQPAAGIIEVAHGGTLLDSTTRTITLATNEVTR
jgi:ATP-binding cassette, subfamily C, bacterial CydCD